PPGITGLWTSCGYFSCGAVTHMNVTITGRTPDTAAMPVGESAVLAQVHAVDGHGRLVADLIDTFGNNSSGAGCGGPEPHQCNFGFGFGWDCTNAAGASANLNCLVGVNVLATPAVTCADLTHVQAPIVQGAHGPVKPALPPGVTASAVPAAGAGTWDHQPVAVTVTATDQGGGVGSVGYQAAGAETIAPTTVPGNQTTVTLGAEGVTSLRYWATDKLGTASKPQTLTVQLDLSAPSVVCAAPDGQWHATDVSLACTAADPFSGLADPSAGSFQLSTSVPSGTETANAATGARQVCDAVGNCAGVGPISGNKVDRKPPAITISAPGGAYTV